MPRKAPSPSPDPLALVSDDSADCIEAITPKNAKAGPSRTTTPRSKVKPVVEIPSPKRPRPPRPVNDLLPRLKRTPLAKSSPGSNRGTPTPVPSPTPLKKAKINGTTPKQLRTPTKGSQTPAKSVPRSAIKGTPTLGSSIKQPLPTSSPLTSSRKRPRLESPKKATAPNVHTGLSFDNTFDDPSSSSVSAVSRETFLANEALKRQREARNWKYTGDANAPKLTRSGKVIGETEVEEGDDYGEELNKDIREEEIRLVPQPVLPEVEVKDTNSIIPLLPAAKTLVLDMLAALTGSGIATNPPPFHEEEKNEALGGLVNLLKGTVERGEGNSALLVGARGVGKTRTIARALNLLPSGSTTSPIIVRLSGHAQINDRLAIREMGRQIAEAEGKDAEVEEEDGEGQEDAEYAPTTLPSHLLALLTASSPRAIIIVIEEFDLFTEHARQALLYCLLDVVQSVKTGPTETTGRGIAVIGVTSRVDTLLLLEKRVKSRFSHRMWRVVSPLAPDQLGWKEVMKRVLTPWEYASEPGSTGSAKQSKEDRGVTKWKGDWQFAVDTLLDHEKINKALDRLVGLTTDVRLLYRPFIPPIAEVLSGTRDYLSVSTLTRSIINQVEDSSWGLTTLKLKGLPQPALGILIISKHLSFAGKDEFTFAMVEEEYLRFSRTKLVGSGKTRWPLSILRSEFDHLLRLSLFAPAGNSNVKPRFAKVRCTLAPHEIVAWMKGDGAIGMGPEMVGWGRMMGGHV